MDGGTNALFLYLAARIRDKNVRRDMWCSLTRACFRRAGRHWCLLEEVARGGCNYKRTRNYGENTTNKMLSKSVNSSARFNAGQRAEINPLKPTAFLQVWLRVILSLSKPLGKVHTSRLSLSLLLVLSHSAADEDKTEMTPLKESESGGKVKERHLAPSSSLFGM